MPTEATRQACDHLLDYLATHPLSVIRYYASDMILCLVSDAAYLVLPNARSRCATLYTLTNKSTASSTPDPNGPLHVLCKTIKGVTASASEAETGGIFLGTQEACALIQTLIELGHPQPISGTPIETDNSTAHDILTAQVRMKRSKAFDMRYHWIKDRIAQKQFDLYWSTGRLNRGDYFTKHHPPAHHRLMRSKYLQTPDVHLANSFVPTHVRGCVPPPLSYRQIVPRILARLSNLPVSPDHGPPGLTRFPRLSFSTACPKPGLPVCQSHFSQPGPPVRPPVPARFPLSLHQSCFNTLVASS